MRRDVNVTRKMVSIRNMVWVKLARKAAMNNRTVGKYVVQLLEEHTDSFRGEDSERLNVD
jgi:macrodomain Ter protein organizer (MatP/YcbG family)